MRDLRTLSDSPLYVPHYLSEERCAELVRWAKRNWHGEMGETGRRTTDYVRLPLVEDLIPSWARLLEHQKLSFINDYRNHLLGWHQDDLPDGGVSCVFGLDGVGTLSFWKIYELPCYNARRDVPEESAIWTFTIHPGDAFFWTPECERAGWYHGGNCGNRMSLVLRYQEKGTERIDGTPQ